MHLRSEIIVIISSLLSFCQTQTYPVQRRYSYSQPATLPSTFYYIPSTTNHQSSENGKPPSSYYNSLLHPLDSNSNNKQTAPRNSNFYGSSIGSYSSYEQTTTKKGTTHPYSQSTQNSIKSNYNSIPLKENDRNLFSSSASSNPYSSIDSLRNNKYLTNSYNADNYRKVSSSSANINGKYRVSKADAKNSKFAGAENQEKDEDGRTLHLKRRKFHRRFGGVLGNPCSPFGRSAGSGVTSSPKEQARFLWDVNVYNVYPQSSINCGGYSGFGTGLGGALGAGLLSDPIGPAYYPPGGGIANFLGLFAPGILQNALAATARPQQFADYGQTSNGGSDLQSDPEVDPNYSPGPAAVPVRRPNRVFYDSAGAVSAECLML